MCSYIFFLIIAKQEHGKEKKIGLAKKKTIQKTITSAKQRTGGRGGEIPTNLKRRPYTLSPTVPTTQSDILPFAGKMQHLQQ